MRFTDKRTGPEIALESVSPGDIIIMDFVPYVVTEKVIAGVITSYDIIECYNLETGQCKLFDGNVKVRKLCFATYVNFEEESEC